jgi:aspartate beta-hydroxylase
MDYHPLKDRLNDFLLQHIGEDRPAYLDIDEMHPELNDLTEHFDLIRDEWDAVEASGAPLPRYHEVEPGQMEVSGEVEPDKDWKVFMLDLLGYKPEANRARCPLTSRLIDDIPDLVQAFFSVLEPGKSVPCHRGPYLGYLRYHLGIKVPRHNPPTLVVNKQPYVWREGEAVMFDDSHPHMVINRSNEPRVVLIVDVLRQLPWHLSALNKAVVFGLAKPAYYRKVMQRVERVSATALH